MVGSKLVPPTLEIRPELGLIVDLPVKNDTDLSVFIPHRLTSRCDVNDSQPSMAEKDMRSLVDEKTFAVRPTMCKCGGHTLEILRRSDTHKTDYPAHALRIPLEIQQLS